MYTKIEQLVLEVERDETEAEGEETEAEGGGDRGKERRG